MKLHLNAVGFTDSKFIKIGERLIAAGIALAGTGLIVLIKTQEWNIGSTSAHLEYFTEVFNELHK